MNFKNPVIGQASTVGSASIANIGNAPFQLDSVLVSGEDAGDFHIVRNGCAVKSENRLTPQESCAVQVVFKPLRAGVRQAMLTISSDAASV